MIIGILRRNVKWCLTTICAAYLGYLYSGTIDNVKNSVKYSFNDAKSGFIAKEQALDLKIIYERNSAKNLETYLKVYNEKLAVYQRENGIIVGEPEYVFKNFTIQERTNLCSFAFSEDKPEKNKNNNVDFYEGHNNSVSHKAKRFVYNILENLEGLKND